MPDLEIFLSWSRPLSHQAAEVLKDWFPEVLPGTKPWMSSEDITKGTPWFTSLSSQLTRSRVCLICVTPENVNSSWLYYESGAIAHAMQEAIICPYLIGVKPGDLTGTPLVQYQCTAFNKDDTWLLIRSVNGKLEQPHDERVLRGNFDANWPTLQRKIAKIDAQTQVEAENPKEPDLSQEAQAILVETLQDRGGGLLAIKYSGGYTVQTNGKNLTSRRDAREEATFRSAINDLVSRGLIEPRGNKGTSFALTKRGFDLADNLRSLQPKAPTPTLLATMDNNDILCLLQSWFSTLAEVEKQRAISFSEVDRQLKLSQGSAARLLETAAQKLHYIPDQKGTNVVVFRKVAPAGAEPFLSNPR